MLQHLISDMATAKLYLDTRYRKSPEALASIKIAINHRGRSSAILTGLRIHPESWDKTRSVVKSHPQAKKYNAALLEQLSAVTRIIETLTCKINLKEIDVTELVNKIKSEISGDAPKSPDTSLLHWFGKFAETKTGRTKQIYEATYKKLQDFLNTKWITHNINSVNREWLTEFDMYLSEQAPSANSRAIHMRNLRAVYNYAIDCEATINYPFRRYKIKTVATKKRNLEIEIMRKIFSYKSDDAQLQRYLDTFKLTFLLIGINIVDLCHLDEIREGRVSYSRSKTKRIYDIKVEPEALSLIEQYRGEKHLLNYLDTCSHYRHYYNRMAIGLRKLAEVFGVTELTTYYARHTWATIASSLGVPKDTIAQALGHGGHSVTDIYIAYDNKQVDEANRKVIDYVISSEIR